MDLIERQDAINAILDDKIFGKALIVMNALGEGRLALTLNDACDRHIRAIEQLPSAQPERKKGKWMEIDKYFHMYGTKDNILFEEVEKPEQPEKKTGRWMTRGKSLHYCSECGWALMDSEGGDQPYMGIGYNRSNEERWICCPGWNSWLMNFCPNCGADMRKSI